MRTIRVDVCCASLLGLCLLNCGSPVFTLGASVEGDSTSIPAPAAVAGEAFSESFELPLVSEAEEEKRYMDFVLDVFNHGDYAKWETATNAILEQDEYFASGSSRASILFDKIAQVRDAEEQSDNMAFFQRLDEWEHFFPESRGRDLVRLNTLLDKAWDIRGRDYANTVTPAGWRGFRKYLNEAEELAQELVDGGMDHPELYASLLEVCLCKGYDEETLIKWFQKGLAKAPFYEHCYWQIANYYRKVWYGKPGHYQPIIDAAVEATRTRIGNAAGYYVFYQILLTDTDVFKASKNVSWSQVKGGYTDFIKVFPENAHHLNHVCRMACAFHERDDARMYFERIGERHAGEVWRKEMFDLWKNWACAGGGLPVSQPIHKAAQAGDVQGVRLELNHGVASNLLDEQGRTPMVLAIEQEAWPVVRLLLAHGADPNTRVDGRSLSGLVVSSGQLELLQDLLARGIDPNTVDEDGWTLLHTAASEDYAEVLRLLLSQPGIKVDSLTEQQLTPLSLAVRGKQVNAAKLLVERGASLKITGKNSNPPLVAAAGVGATDIAKFLLEKGADPNLFLPTSWTALTAAIDGGNSELVDALLAHGADVNRADGDGWTAMHMAAMNGNLPLLERLLNSPGANISVATNEGRTLLHQAVKSDQLDVLKFLLERGMKPEVTNREGETALDFARELGRKEIEAYLVSIGASANK